jgi:hypothetical protein
MFMQRAKKEENIFRNVRGFRENDVEVGAVIISVVICQSTIIL